MNAIRIVTDVLRRVSRKMLERRLQSNQCITFTAAATTMMMHQASDISDSVTLTVQEPPPGRTHSYLPYSNHPPDISQARHGSLYLEDEPPAKSLTVHSCQRLHSLLHLPTMLADTRNTKPSTSLTDLTRRQQQRKRRRLDPRLFWIFIVVACILAAGGVVTFVCWPRVPRVRLSPASAATVPRDVTDWGPDPQHPWLKTLWQVNVTLDNRDNFIPTRISGLTLIMADQATSQPFARASTGPFLLAPRSETSMGMLFNVEYETPSMEDPTFQHLYNACGPQKISTSLPPALNITLQVLKMMDTK